VGRGLELHLCREHPLRRPRPTDRFVPFSERSHFEFDRQHTLEAVWKLDVRVVVRKVDLSDRPWIDDRHRGRGSMTPETARRQSFHTASLHTSHSRVANDFLQWVWSTSSPGALSLEPLHVAGAQDADAQERQR